MKQPNKTQEYYESSTKTSLSVQLSTIIAGILLLSVGTAKIHIASFICAILAPVVFITSLVAGIITARNGRHGWKTYRSKSARRRYRVASFLITAPIIITITVTTTAIISEYF